MAASHAILVFHTDAIARDRIVDALRRAGHGILATGSAEEAAEMTDDYRVDLAVVEAPTASLDSLEIACRAKADRTFVPVVWLGEDEGRSEMRGYVRNTDGYLSQPFLDADLCQQVALLLEARDAHREALAAGLRVPETDAVTGLYNAQGLAERLSHETALGRERGTPVSLLLVDVDDFHRVNTEVGFARGNAVLRQLGDWLSQGLRSVDFACRYGPDEFAVVLPFTDDVGAVIAAERLREEVRLQDFEAGEPEAGAPPLRLSLSIGVAASSLLGYDAEALMRLADEAVGAAKTTKNRVVLGGH